MTDTYTYDTRHRTTVRHAGGYTYVYEGYGVGTPGYHVDIVRDSDRVCMWSGPNVHGPHAHADWKAAGRNERTRIMDALRAAPVCDKSPECTICRGYGVRTPEEIEAAQQANDRRWSARLTLKYGRETEPYPDGMTYVEEARRVSATLVNGDRVVLESPDRSPVRGQVRRVYGLFPVTDYRRGPKTVREQYMCHEIAEHMTHNRRHTVADVPTMLREIGRLLDQGWRLVGYVPDCDKLRAAGWPYAYKAVPA